VTGFRLDDHRFGSRDKTALALLEVFLVRKGHCVPRLFQDLDCMFGRRLAFRMEVLDVTGMRGAAQQCERRCHTKRAK
jgi:hypothetical protein